MEQVSYGTGVLRIFLSMHLHAAYIVKQFCDVYISLQEFSQQTPYEEEVNSVQ